MQFFMVFPAQLIEYILEIDLKILDSRKIFLTIHKNPGLICSFTLPSARMQRKIINLGRREAPTKQFV